MNILIRCFGCTANFGEAAEHMKTLKKAGHIIVNDPSLADIALVQTCCVIERTELNMLREIERLRESSVPVIVSGCMAAVRRKMIEMRFPEVRFIPFGKDDPVGSSHFQAEPGGLGFSSEENRLVPLIEEMFKDPGGARTHPGLARASSIPMETLINSNIVSGDTNKLSATHIEAISNGCMGNCSYCITRLARGRLHSYPASKIRSGIREALRDGKKEIFLTSQDNGVYGMDRKTSPEDNGERYGLPELLKNILGDNEDMDFRLRVGMMNPWGLALIMDDLVPLLNNRKIYSFLHIPVQSGDDPILKAMARRYTVSDYEELVDRLRSDIPDLTISTDVIAGFPGEDEASFERTRELMERIAPDVINITRFSARPGTRALEMKEKVPGWKAKERSRVLTKLRFDITSRRLVKWRGRTADVLTVERGKNGSTLARTDNYATVVIRRPIPLGEFIRVKITDSTDIYLVGETVRT